MNKTKSFVEDIVTLAGLTFLGFCGVFLTALTLQSCDDIGPNTLDDLDNGFLETATGDVICPPLWPVTVGFDGASFYAETSTDLPALLEEAVRVNDDDLGGGFATAEFVGESTSAFAVFSVGGIPLQGADVFDLQDELELTTVVWDRDTMTVIGCSVVLNTDLAYDDDTMLLSMRHALGHCAWALADDAGPPTTIDLRSIMAKPADPLGRLTDHDRELLLEMR